MRAAAQFCRSEQSHERSPLRLGLGYRSGQMTTLVAAGVDVGRDFLDVALAPSGQAFRVANQPAGIATLLQRLKRSGVPKDEEPRPTDWTPRSLRASL